MKDRQTSENPERVQGRSAGVPRSPVALPPSDGGVLAASSRDAHRDGAVTRSRDGRATQPALSSILHLPSSQRADALQALESVMLKMPQANCPVTNLFAPGIYWREITIPAGVIALGHKHKSEHINVMLSGRVRVFCDGEVRELVAPQVFSSPPCVRKLVYALEPTRWANVHANPTDETDMAKLELIFIEKSTTFLAHQHQEEIARLTSGQSGSSALPYNERSE